MTESVRHRSPALTRELMRTKGYSYREIAERVGCGKTMIQRLVTDDPGQRKSTCSARLGERIAEVLGVPAEVLFAPSPSTRRGRPPTTKKEAEAA